MTVTLTLKAPCGHEVEVPERARDYVCEIRCRFPKCARYWRVRVVGDRPCWLLPS